MYIEKVPNRNYPPAVLRPDSYQEGNQVKKRTLANSLAERSTKAHAEVSLNHLSKLPDDIIDNRHLQKL
ncbi:MAG: hypothetical protein RPG89_16345 [Microcystis panniformis WG22]|uniref:Uncharacterized protein n=1 Tax=Microcystis aeruginosa Ma_MB_F_20061100_S20D TaxID=2486253 RepID=A0A552EYQ2_MICAE|nr:hypothetical protein [Microcystis panniformis WG22]TRU39594.1 MAG: hypothetical protein EWV78_02980 [Microcystis aeruginosa Ma_MB_F_20061100_S20D]TRU42703.1 MAG: hypothetical protein EWV50_02495 [Microcystis aeruginosa Ma_MB_F_20061100_S20]